MQHLSLNKVMKVVTQKKLGRGDKLALMSILIAADDDTAETSESYASIAACVGVHFKTIKSALARLQDEGFIYVSKPHRTLNVITVIEPDRFRLYPKPRRKAA